MKLHAGDKRTDRFKRFDEFTQLVERCSVSREERRGTYGARRLAYLYGNDGGFANSDLDTGGLPPASNKIYPHLDQVTAFLYAQATVHFSCEFSVAAPAHEMGRVDVINNYFSDLWHRSNLDIVFGTALLWSLVYGCTFVKPVWRGNTLYPGLVMPHNVGVLREDEMQLSRQDAFCHWYKITESQFRQDFALVPRLESILGKIEKRGVGVLETQEAGVDRIIMSAMHPFGSAGGGPTGTGMSDWMSLAALAYVPRVKEEMIDMVELVVYDDALRDYRLVTLASPDIVIFDRPLKDTGWLPNEPPLIQVCPTPMPDYFWGTSEVERLMPLQRRRNRALAQIEHLQDLQAHSPWTSSGFPAPELLEMAYVLDSPGGFLNQPDPSGIGGGGPKAERVKIEVPSDLYERIARIDEEFDEMSGLPPVTRGQNPSGVRAAGHAAELAKMGSSRARKRALIVEDQLEHVATVSLKLVAKNDSTILKAPVLGGKPEDVESFVMSQVSDDYMMTVDAHSNSPIFSDDLTQLVLSLAKAKMIEREDALALLPNLPHRRQLIHKLRTVIEPAEAKAHQEAEQHDLQKAQIAGLRGRPRKIGNGSAQTGEPPQ